MTNIDLNIRLIRIFSTAAIASATTEKIAAVKQLKAFSTDAVSAQRHDLAGDADQLCRTLIHELRNRRPYEQRYA
ncbi:hypothetical protein NM74_07975 [Aeromonas hydrophila]|uniref:hypothetical protein n=1 Tax=Aeromonas hydrophila TaxID=644 RepID=UPI000536B004|nr:hypothetical protein [Aeromonas hydrophila]KHA57143.1 hypothetical protein NM74_07975 [Aeromonas hydrophila]